MDRSEILAAFQALGMARFEPCDSAFPSSCVEGSGAGDRNRTGVMTLEGSGSASELRPRGSDISVLAGGGCPLDHGRDPVEDVGFKVVQRDWWGALKRVAHED